MSPREGHHLRTLCRGLRIMCGAVEPRILWPTPPIRLHGVFKKSWGLCGFFMCKNRLEHIYLILSFAKELTIFLK